MWALYLLVGAMCGASVMAVLMGCLAAGASEERELDAFRAGYRRAKNLPPVQSENVAA